jgi:hypothetical protein
VTDIFREVEEDVRRERYEQLWKEYGDYVIAGAAVVVIAVAGFQLWRVYDQRQRARASAEFMVAEQLLEAGQTSEAQSAFAHMEKDTPGGYASLSKFQEANTMLQAGNTADAVIIYKQIAAGKDDILSPAARIHAGLALVDTAPKSEIQSLVSPLTDRTNPWHGMAQDILAFADYHAGATQAAIGEYQILSTDTDAPAPLRARAGWMVTFLKGGGARNYGTVPPPPTPPSASPSQPQGAAGGPSRQ